MKSNIYDSTHKTALLIKEITTEYSRSLCVIVEPAYFNYEYIVIATQTQSIEDGVSVFGSDENFKTITEYPIANHILGCKDLKEVFNLIGYTLQEHLI